MYDDEYYKRLMQIVSEIKTPDTEGSHMRLIKGKFSKQQNAYMKTWVSIKPEESKDSKNGKNGRT